MRLFWIAILVCAVGGCSAYDMRRSQWTGGHHADVSVPFDPAAVKYIKAPGSATITGRVSLTVESGPLIGDFAKIRLVPVAAYSEAVMAHMFDGGKSYFTPKSVDNIDRRYEQFMRFGQSDENGIYTLYGVPPGQYFVYATMANHSAGIYFAVHERIEVADGQKYKLDLDGI